MSPERWREVEQVYQSTMDREPQLRAAYLVEACGDDQELRREVDSLLDLNHSPVLVDEPAWQAVAELLTDSTQLAPGTLLGPYRIEAMLGAGGMGQVYQAQDTRLGRTVALKISRVEFNARFEREARAVAALNHPNICTFHDVGSQLSGDGTGGRPDACRAHEAGPIPLEEALRIARQIADALEAAHEKGIIHRDLKPGNIKIKPDGTVKVLDFGLAKIATGRCRAGDQARGSPTISMAATAAGMILGTAAYMSPEQARGMPVDKRADIWAFGVVLYEMLTGRRSFAGETVSDTLAAVLKTDPDWSALPAETPQPIRRLLRRSLERDRKRRLPDIAVARLEIDEAMGESPETPAVAAQPARRGILPWCIAALALVAFGVALALGHFREQPAGTASGAFSDSSAGKGQLQLQLPASHRTAVV